MWWRKEKRKPVKEISEAQERALRKVADKILSLQRKWATWMNSWFNKLPMRWKKGLVIVFVLLVSLILIWPYLRLD